MTKVMVLGASGMLGNAMFRILSKDSTLNVYGTVRDVNAVRHFPHTFSNRLISHVDVDNQDSLAKAFAAIRPNVVINCIGLVKQLEDSSDPLLAIPINSLLPHRLAALCQLGGARLVHFSTDCVFSGSKGGYVESDPADANDLYGRTKLLGEVDHPHAITLRTSIIGHELTGQRSLVNWFLSQQRTVSGYTRAIFSGLTTVELSCLIRDMVLPRTDLRGLYHVAAQPIAKFDLLTLLAKVYRKDIEIVPDNKVVIDRSLNAERFRVATGYMAPSWPSLIERMYEFK